MLVEIAADHFAVLGPGRERDCRTVNADKAFAVIVHEGEERCLLFRIHLLVLAEEGGDLEMNTEQKAALLSFVHDDGKGFIGVHSATITFTAWSEYGEMIGGYFDEHPWGTFDAPILVEDPNFPGMQQFAKSVILKDEIYQIKDFSRDRVRVLMRLDASKLDLNNSRVHRKDLDFAVTWAKMYGKGRVFYSALGHVEQNWDDPRIQKMYVEAIKWAMGLANADVTPRPHSPD